MLAAATGNSGGKSEPTTVAHHPQAWPEAIEVVESSYDWSGSRPLNWFFFIFLAQLGHPVYV